MVDGSSLMSLNDIFRDESVREKVILENIRLARFFLQVVNFDVKLFIFFPQVVETAKLFYSNSFISINLYQYIAWGINNNSIYKNKVDLEKNIDQPNNFLN